MGELGHAFGPRALPADERLQRRQELCIGVEHAVHLSHVAGTERRLENRLVTVVPVVPRRKPAVIGDVARRLLEIGHEPSSLEDLCEQVRRLLTGEMDRRPAGRPSRPRSH